MNLRGSILLGMPDICKVEGVDSRIFDPRASPQKDSEEMKKARKEIRERYLDLLSRIPFHIVEDFYDHNRGYPKEKVDEVKRAIEKSFEGAFKYFLDDIKDRYKDKKEIWQVKRVQRKKEKENDRK